MYIIPAEEMTLMGEFVTKATRSAQQKGARSDVLGEMVTVLSKICSVKKEGNDILGVLLLGQRADRKEACEVWVVEEVDSEVILIIDDSLSRWGGKQGDDRPEEGCFSFVLLSQDCHRARVQVRLPHRYHRTHRV